ncbi:trigger factor [Motiliproteus sp. MSK22-1]|uniref:trigger factor n=1 Tax=Motiliproteus sp. MSK22-1 TaxID=1897630 RepID=UPI000976C9E5|nr:trigger factor [Motiliproteus sp. MSK22-1]OMH38784.1 trigger factor [Motiliproteus sp. MSK22-1]
MQVSVETTSSLERQMTITVPAARIEDDVNSRLKQTARSARIDGFRPGKVPFKVIKRRYGKGAREEVLGEVIQHTFYEALTQEKLKPAGGPSIEAKNDNEGEDFQYVATFEVYPEIELADFSGVEVVKEASEVSEEDIAKMVEVLQKQHAEWNVVEKAAEDGDRVNLDFEGFKDGEAFEGGKSEGHDLVLGSSTMIPGFEDGIVGLKAGDEKELTLSFPEEYHAEHLAGQEVVFKIKINSVSSPELPELNAELFAKFGVNAETLDDFKAEIGKNMEREVKQALKGKLKTKVLNELVKVNTIDVPKSLVDGEVDRLREQAVQQFGGGADMDPKALPAELFTEQAKQRVSIGLLVAEIIASKELKADPERVQETIAEMAQTYEQPQEVIDYYNSNKEQLSQIEALVLEDQVVDSLLAEAKVSEVVVGYEEAIKPAAPEAEENVEEEKGE